MAGNVRPAWEFPGCFLRDRTTWPRVQARRRRSAARRRRHNRRTASPPRRSRPLRDGWVEAPGVLRPTVDRLCGARLVDGAVVLGQRVGRPQDLDHRRLHFGVGTTISGRRPRLPPPRTRTARRTPASPPSSRRSRGRRHRSAIHRCTSSSAARRRGRGRRRSRRDGSPRRGCSTTAEWWSNRATRRCIRAALPCLPIRVYVLVQRTGAGMLVEVQYQRRCTGAVVAAGHRQLVRALLAVRSDVHPGAGRGVGEPDTVGRQGRGRHRCGRRERRR